VKAWSPAARTCVLRGCSILPLSKYLLSFFFIFLRWCETVHLVRRPLFGLLYQPWMMDDDGCGTVSGMIGKVLGENLPLCHFVHQKSRMT
jgi:hypothetical protein